MSDADGLPGNAASDRRLFFSVLFAHGFARVLSKLASAPLERVKICAQVGLAYPGCLYMFLPHVVIILLLENLLSLVA